MRVAWLILLAACDRTSASTWSVPEPMPTGLTIDVAEGLASPESIVHDPDADVYLVSNINGDPDLLDNNGYISKIAPDGTVLAQKWIAGGVAGVTLHAPRGMALDADTLYVVDRDAVRLFDRASGTPKGEWKVPDAQFPNDIRVDGHGNVLVTETAIKLVGAGANPVGTAAIWRFDHDGHPTAIARGNQLEGPNGIALYGDDIMIASFTGYDLYRLDGDKPVPLATFPTSNLDGLVQLPDGSFLVTSWQARGIYRVWTDGTWKLVMHESGLVGPASIEYDRKRHRVLVPLVLAGALRFEELEP